MESTNELDLQAQTLRGDVRDRYLDLMRSMPKGWTELPEKEQRRIIEQADGYARDVVQTAFVLFAQRGLTKIAVVTGKWAVKEGVKLEVSALSTKENINALAEHGQGSAVLVLADVDWFMGARSEPKPLPDQPDLPMGEAAAGGQAAAGAEADQVAANTAAIEGGISELQPEADQPRRRGRKTNAEKAREMAEAGDRAKAEKAAREGGAREAEVEDEETPTDAMRSSTAAGDAFLREEARKRAEAAGEDPPAQPAAPPVPEPVA